jgi:hypothetical protein
MDHAFDLANISNTTGCPIFAFFAKGGPIHATSALALVQNKIGPLKAARGFKLTASG